MPNWSLVRLSDWSAIIAPMLVLTEFRDMVSYPSGPVKYPPFASSLPIVLSES